jgi:predicted GNAT family N-acyltransferase
MAVDTAPPFTVRVVDWAREADKLRAIRIKVFVVEQNIPEELEWDEFDARSVHAIAEDAHGGPIGCGRLLPDGHIGRMAVISDWRGRGVGAALLVRLIELARARGDPRVLLNSQTRAMPFYARFGFVPVGAEYEEAGIPHWTMERALIRP